jgi:hypothetical protein
MEVGMKRNPILVLAFGFVAILPAVAGADVVTDCQRVIRSVPVTINNPGTYCLERNESTSITTGAAITVNANDVTIDLKGFKLDGSGAGAGTLTIGVLASSRRGVTVRNGRIRGFVHGVQINGTGATIEDLSLDSNTDVGVYCSGTACTVRRNNIWNTGGAVLPPPGTESSVGIVNYSNAGQTYDNTVSSFLNLANQFPSGIEVGLAAGGIVRNNRLIGPGLLQGNGIHVLLGGGVLPTSAVLVSGNEIVSFKTGVAGAAGVCRATSNRLYDVGTPITGCTDAGDNN